MNQNRCETPIADRVEALVSILDHAAWIDGMPPSSEAVPGEHEDPQRLVTYLKDDLGPLGLGLPDPEAHMSGGEVAAELRLFAALTGASLGFPEFSER